MQFNIIHSLSSEYIFLFLVTLSSFFSYSNFHSLFLWWENMTFTHRVMKFYSQSSFEKLAFRPIKLYSPILCSNTGPWVMPTQPFVGPPCSLEWRTDLAVKNEKVLFFFYWLMTVIHTCFPLQHLVVWYWTQCKEKMGRSSGSGGQCLSPTVRKIMAATNSSKEIKLYFSSLLWPAYCLVLNVVSHFLLICSFNVHLLFHCAWWKETLSSHHLPLLALVFLLFAFGQHLHLWRYAVIQLKHRSSEKWAIIV